MTVVVMTHSPPFDNSALMVLVNKTSYSEIVRQKPSEVGFKHCLWRFQLNLHNWNFAFRFQLNSLNSLIV